MGQGIHTKVAQVCAECLDTDVKNVYICESATNLVPNASATAASVGSDINGMAVKDACDKIMERLKPYREKKPDATLSELAKMAYFDRVSLSATGFYRTPNIEYDWDKNEGRMFFYFTTGVAVTEVELDLLSGDHMVLRADIKMDVGRSLNHAIDIGQIEGAFVQGAGWSTMEETLFFPNGHLFTRGPGNYKIPGFRDVPQHFRVALLQNVDYHHLKTIQSSKGIGEPPLFLGSSVFFALRDAIKYAQAEYGEQGVVRLQAPATAARLRIACGDWLAKTATSQVLTTAAEEKDWVVVV